MKNQAYPINGTGPTSSPEETGPAGAQGSSRQSTKTIAKKSSTASDGTSQDLRAVVALVMTLSATDRQRLAAVLAAFVVVAEADMTPKEAAHRLGISVSTVRSRCASGRLGRRVGGRWRIPPAEVRAMLEGGRP